jgi:hypothetical protein
VAGQHAPPAPPEHPRRSRGRVWRDETQHAARTQHLPDLGQGADRIGEVLEHVDHEHGVEGAGVKAGLLQVALKHVKAKVPGPPHSPVRQLDALGAPAAAAGLVEQQPDPTTDVQDQGRASFAEIGAGRRQKLPAGRAAGSLLGDVRLVDHLGVRSLQLALDHPGLENPTARAAVQLRLLARVVTGRGDLLAGGGGGRALVGQRQLGGAADPAGRGGQSRPSLSFWVEDSQRWRVGPRLRLVHLWRRPTAAATTRVNQVSTPSAKPMLSAAMWGRSPADLTGGAAASRPSDRRHPARVSFGSSGGRRVVMVGGSATGLAVAGPPLDRGH